MRIGLLHESVLPPRTYGGIERIMVALARAYRRRGHEVVVLCKAGSRAEAIAENADDVASGRLRVHELPPDFQSRQPEQWLPRDLDFLHSHQPLPIRPPIPFLVTIHGNGQPTERYWRNTNFLSQSHARNHNAKYFVYNGVDPARYTFRAEKEDYFVFLARTTWRVKNVKTAIAWADELGVRLEIMGGAGISRGRIRYAGLVDESTKVNLLAGAKALIYPTNWDEPCAGAPLEALACGTPVISTANGCMPELVRPGTGVVCRSYEELLDAPRALVQVQPEACRKAVETFFSDERMADDYLALMTKILKEGELEHEPRFNFDSSSVQLLYKPTMWNRLRLAVTGKV